MIFEGIIPAATTPFSGDGTIDDDGIARNLGRMLVAGVQAVVTTGTMGESGALSADERRHVTELHVELAGGRARIVSGISADSWRSAARHAEVAAEVGAHGLMCLPPVGYHADGAELHAHFSAVASASALPLCLYNNPEASRNDMPARLVAELCEIEGVAAVKECSGDARRIAELIELTEGRISILVGGDDWALEGAAAGAVGWISGAAVVLPAECVELWRLCQAGDWTRARELYLSLLPLCRLDMYPKLVQYFKAGLDLVGGVGGPCRPPRDHALSADEQRRLERALTVAERVPA
jgi:1-pyrroline-4-hydroxy-2-carboxylate deaminase